MKLHEIVGGVAFLLALGIVGSVDNGAPVGRMVWAFICIGIFAACIFVGDSYKLHHRR